MFRYSERSIRAMIRDKRLEALVLSAPGSNHKKKLISDTAIQDYIDRNTIEVNCNLKPAARPVQATNQSVARRRKSDSSQNGGGFLEIVCGGFD